MGKSERVLSAVDRLWDLRLEYWQVRLFIVVRVLLRSSSNGENGINS